MEWATGVTYRNRDLVVDLLSGTQRTQISLCELGTRGIPTPAKKGRSVVETDLNSWRRTAPDEFLAAFGMHHDTDNHDVFEFRDDRFRYLIPALVLMRGLFRPHRHVLAELFRPHGLELVCSPISLDGRLSVIPVNYWASYHRPITMPSILEPLAWMYGFPSAHQMCGSVHEYALQGRLSLDLPLGRAKLALHWNKAGDTRYVAGLTIVSLETKEVPYEYAKSQPKRIVFHRGEEAAIGNGNCRKLRDSLVPFHMDGGTDITDREWAHLQRVLTVTKQRRLHDLRLILDGVLAKLASGASWRAADYKAGTWINASNLLQKLRKTGEWSEIVDTLNECRADSNQAVLAS